MGRAYEKGYQGFGDSDSLVIGATCELGPRLLSGFYKRYGVESRHRESLASKEALDELMTMERRQVEVEKWSSTLTTQENVKALETALKELGEDSCSICKDQSSALQVPLQT